MLHNQWCNVLLDGTGVYERMARANNPYGDGKASERIGFVLKKALNAKL